MAHSPDNEMAAAAESTTLLSDEEIDNNDQAALVYYDLSHPASFGGVQRLAKVLKTGPGNGLAHKTPTLCTDRYADDFVAGAQLCAGQVCRCKPILWM